MSAFELDVLAIPELPVVAAQTLDFELGR